MKKNLMIISGCAMLLFFSAFGYCADGLYVGGNIGLALTSDSDFTDSSPPATAGTVENESGLTFGLAVGFAFGSPRVEAEISYQKSDFDKFTAPGVNSDLTGDTTSLAFLINGYYDFVNLTPFTPYVTGGVGFARVEFNDFRTVGLPALSDDDTVFAYQVGAGIGYALTDRITIDAKYRYFATSDPEFDTTEVETGSHNILIGVRISF